MTTTTYNAANKYVSQTVVADAGTGKLNLTTAFTYDAVGNLTQVNVPRTDVTDTITQTTDALGKQTRFAFDADGRLIRTAAQLGTSGWSSAAPTPPPNGCGHHLPDSRRPGCGHRLRRPRPADPRHRGTARGRVRQPGPSRRGRPFH